MIHRNSVTILLVATACLLWITGVGSAATISVDNSASAFASGGGNSATISSFAVANNPHRMLVVGVGGERGATPSSVTYGGVAMTEVASANSLDLGSDGSIASIWVLSSPAPGPGDVAVTIPTTFPTNAWRFGAVSIFGDNPLAVIDSDTAIGTNTASATLNLDLDSDDFFFSVAEKNDAPGFLTSPGGLTNLFSGDGSGGFFTSGDYNAAPSGTSFTWTWGTSERHAFAGIGITVVPEPSALALGLTGLLLFSLRRRRRS